MLEKLTKRPRHLPLVLIPILVVTDQATKVWIRKLFDEVVGDQITVIPGFFDLTYVQNTGAAWGMLGDHTGWLTGVYSRPMLPLSTWFFPPLRWPTTRSRSR